MNTEVITLIAKSGVWAVLFVSLLYYVLYDARRRENKYQNIIDKLSDKLDCVEEIKVSVNETKINVEELKINCKKNTKTLKENL